MSTGNTLLGKVGLGSSILGILLPVCVAMIGFQFAKPGSRAGPSADEVAVLALSGILFLILELLALGCGIAARRTASGLTGLAISGVLFLSIPPLIGADSAWYVALTFGVPLLLFLVWMAFGIRALFQK